MSCTLALADRWSDGLQFLALDGINQLDGKGQQLSLAMRVPFDVVHSSGYLLNHFPEGLKAYVTCRQLSYELSLLLGQGGRDLGQIADPYRLLEQLDHIMEKVLLLLTARL